MNKIIVPSGSYSFDKTAKTVTVIGTPYTTYFTKEGLLLITNTSTNDIIYNFGCDGYGGTISGDTITLEYDTTSMVNTQSIQIVLYNSTNEQLVIQPTHDNLNTNANLQLSNSDISDTNSLPIKYTDSLNFDSFGRFRTSDTGQRYDVEFIYDEYSDLTDKILIGGGSGSQDPNSRDILLEVKDTVSGSEASLLSHPVPYTPGNSQLPIITGTLNEADIAGGTAFVFVRSTITGTTSETSYSQSQWDNTVDDVDWSQSQIFEMDFQSLKVGRIRFALNRGGIATGILSVTNDNIRKTGYWQQPTLPVGWRIYNDVLYTYTEICYGDEYNAIGFRYRVPKNANTQLRAICATVKSEGGQDLQDIEGLSRTTDLDVTEKTVNTLIPLISIRPKSTFKGKRNLMIALPQSFTVTTNNPIKIIIIQNSTLSGGSWVDVDSDNSMMEVNKTATSLTGGYEVFSDYLSTGKNSPASNTGLLGKKVLWDRRGIETGIFTIAAVKTDSTNASCLAAIRWKEIK